MSSAKVDFDEVRPGDVTNPEWLNGIFGDLAVKSDVIGRTNLRPNGLRGTSFKRSNSEGSASYAPTPAVEGSVGLSAAWPVTFDVFPGILETHLTVPFDIPAHARCRFRLGFEFYATVIAGVLTPGIPAGALAQWRIAGTIGGIAWHDPFSEMWLSGAGVSWGGIWGSAFTEAWYVTGNTPETVTLLQAECMEASGATIEVNRVNLSATVFQRC